MFTHLTKDFLSNRKSIAIGFFFITIGLLFGVWATNIPFIKSKYGFTDANIGMLLLCMQMGALIMNPVAATLVRTQGMRKTVIIGFFILIISFSLIFPQNSVYLLGLALFGCGSGIAITNVSMNTCVGAVEEQDHVKIMSTCHGLFSAGLMIGSFYASTMAGFNILPMYGMFTLAILLCVVLLWAKPVLYSIHDKHQEKKIEKSKISLPSGMLLLLVIISVCINITEGTMADWTAIYMRDITHANAFQVGWGLTCYSFFMALGRFLGDNIIPKFGPKRILTIGSILCIIGLSMAIFFPTPLVAIIGFGFVGAGVSCGAPILYASAARTPGLAPGAGLAIMNTFAMGGFLMGPVLIGAISTVFSLPIAFMVIASLAVVWIYFTIKTPLE